MHATSRHKILSVCHDKMFTCGSADFRARISRCFGLISSVLLFPPSFWSFFVDAMKDVTVMILVVAAIISLVTGLAFEVLRRAYMAAVIGISGMQFNSIYIQLYFFNICLILTTTMMK